MSRRVFPSLVAFFNQSTETQQQIADELGISKAYMSMIKWRERQPDLELALKIADRCNVPLESLIRKAS